MSSMTTTDYLVIGAGCSAMAFVDAYLEADPSSTRTIVIVDSRSQPGGHWVDAYNFVRLHAPSTTYGVGSVKLEDFDQSVSDKRRSFADKTTILKYYKHVMEKFLKTNRVKYYPNSWYDAANNQINPTISQNGMGLKTPTAIDVNVQLKVVDTTYSKIEVPGARNELPFEVSDPELRKRVVPVNTLGDLEKLQSLGFSSLKESEPSRNSEFKTKSTKFVVIGAGKTGADAILQLRKELEVPVEDITWMMPNDSWFLDQEKMWLPSSVDTDPRHASLKWVDPSGVPMFGDAKVSDPEAIVFEFFRSRAENFRIDPTIAPTKFKGATLTADGMRECQNVKDRIVRQGHVKRISRDGLEMTKASSASSNLVPLDGVWDSVIFVDCSARGLPARPCIDIFQGRKVIPQILISFMTSESSAIIGYVEGVRARRSQKSGHQNDDSLLTDEYLNTLLVLESSLEHDQSIPVLVKGAEETGDTPRFALTAEAEAQKNVRAYLLRLMPPESVGAAQKAKPTSKL